MTVVAVLFWSAPAPALTRQEIYRDERLRVLNQETQRLVDDVFQHKSHQLLDPAAKQAALRKLRKATANYEEMIAIIKKQRAEAQGKFLSETFKAELEETCKSLERGYRRIQDSINRLTREVEKKR